MSIAAEDRPVGPVGRVADPDCRPRLSLLGDGPKTIPNRTPGMRRLPQSEGMTCPYCGTDGEDDEWVCPEDIEHALDQVGWAAEQDTASELKRMPKDFNRKVGGGPFGISMEVTGADRLAPHAWIEDLLRELACDRCGREYGVYAIGLFCPDCGAPNLAVHFNREVQLLVSRSISPRVSRTERWAGTCSATHTRM